MYLPLYQQHEEGRDRIGPAKGFYVDRCRCESFTGGVLQAWWMATLSDDLASISLSRLLRKSKSAHR